MVTKQLSGVSGSGEGVLTVMATGDESGIVTCLNAGKPNKNYIGCKFVGMESPHEP